MTDDSGKARRGRPPDYEDGVRVATVIPESELKLIDRLAGEEGTSRSKWIAQAARLRLRALHVIELQLPYRSQRELVDLSQLTPRARAIAEAVAQTTTRFIRIKSLATERELMAPQYHAFYQPADTPITRLWDGWWVAPPQVEAADVLEREARKLYGWYPVAQDGSDLPSSEAARGDDLMHADQCVALLIQLCPGQHKVTGKGVWMRNAVAGGFGYPAPARRTSHGWLWSEAAVRTFADSIAAGGEHVSG